MSKINSATDMVNHLIDTTEKLEIDEIDLDRAKATSRIADSVYRQAKLLLEYKKLTGSPEKIEYLK